MEIAKLYETAAENLEKAIEVCGKSKINLTTLTVIASASGNIYSGINWKTLNDSYEEEPTTSEEEAISKMLLAGETAIESIVKLDAEKKLPVDPEQKYLELIIKLNHENVKSNVLQGKNSKVILTSVNSEIAKFAEQFAPAAPAEEAKDAQNAAAKPNVPELGPNEPEGSAAHAGIDASGLQMIFDDWESSADKAADAENKPFNGNTLPSDKAEVINQVQNMAGNGFQQQNSMYGQPGQQPMQQGQNGMYGQGNMYGGPMQQQGMYQQQGQNGMYGGPMQGGMYGQGGMNGMYQQQSVNMYGGQPMQQQGGMYGGPMQQGMYGQPMYGNQGGIYGGQPMQQQGQGMYGQQQNAGRQSLYLNPANQQNYNMPGAATSAYRSKLQAPVRTSVVNTQSVSVYGTNIGEGDNNAIFKDRLNDILNSSSSSSSSKADENDKLDVMMSAKEKKNAAKKDAKNH